MRGFVMLEFQYMNILTTRITCALFLPVVLIISFLVSFSFTEAVMLKPIADISILNAKLVDVGNDQYSVDFRVRNDSHTQNIGKLKYGVRVQKESGTLLYENVYGDVIFEGPNNSATISAFIEPPLGLPGTYQVFVVVKNESGVLLSATHAGDIESSASGVLPTLESCSIIDAVAGTFNCEVEDIDGGELLTYTIYKDGIYSNVIVLEGTVAADTLDGDFSMNELSPGKYAASFELRDAKSDKVYPSQKILNFEVSGNWASVSFFSSNFIDNTLEATIRFDGSRNSKSERGFNYWVLSDTDEVCASGMFDLTDLIPYKRNISEQLKGECIAPRFVAYLYDGKNPDGTPNIVDTIGEADFASLPVPVNKSNAPYSISTIIMIIVLLVLTVFSWYFFIYKDDTKKYAKKSGAVIGAIFLFILFTPATFVSAAAWSSQDNPHIQFSVNLTKSTYNTDEDIVFTFGFDDSDISNGSYSKTPNTTVSMKVNSGSYSQIIGSSNNATYNVVNIGSISTEGTHTLTFKVPDMCGSAFNYTMFGTGFFGTDDCEFQTTVTVDSTGHDSGSNPTINVSGACTPGSSDTFTFYSYYDGDQNGVADNVYYDIIWDDGTTGRIPLNSGYVQSGVAQTSQVTWPVNKTGNYFVKAMATAQDGKKSVWGTASGGCSVTTQSCGDGVLQMWLGEECDDGDTNNSNSCNNACERNNSTYCGDGVVQAWAGEECDGTAGCTATCLNESSCTSGFGIYSDKSLVRGGDSVDITWMSAGDMTACTVDANGANVWSGNAGTQSKVINSTTKFELSCDSQCSGSRLSTTTTVNIIPTYQEN